jgi:uncharacterized glyoxalase superfamily protein PhnB
MSEPFSVSSTVEVPTDPATAFMIFTEEIDCWWIQGPINFHDFASTYTKRIEPGVGGRLLEVRDATTGEGLELGRITAWEPGTRLAWLSSIDDVETDVSFEAVGDGTLVRVEATIPAGGKDKGGTAWVRATPDWLSAWVAKRDRVPHEPNRVARVAVSVPYAKPATAARWLRDIFGFEEAGRIPDEEPRPEASWIEFHVGDCSIICLGTNDLTEDGAAARAPAPTPWIFVDDLDAQYQRLTAAGAAILTEIWDHGVRAFDAGDLEGNRWTFAQASPLMRDEAPLPLG